MIDHRLTVDEWIDRCAMRLGRLIPALTPADAAQRATELQGDAYECEPEDAAEIYALELPPLEPGSICDYSTSERSAWVLAYKLKGASDDQLAAGVNAAQAVLDAAGVSPFQAVRTMSRLEGWDIAGFPDELALTPKEDWPYDILCKAGNAARDAVLPEGADAIDWGELVARWPSKVRFEAARRRWLARQAKVS